MPPVILQPHDGLWNGPQMLCSCSVLSVSVWAATIALLLPWLLMQKRRLNNLEASLQVLYQQVPCATLADKSPKSQAASAYVVPLQGMQLPQPGFRNTIYGRTPAEQAAGVSPTNFTFPPGDCRRFGYDPTGIHDSTAAINNALRVPGEAFLCEGVAKISSPIRLRSNATLAGVASGPYNEHDPVRGSQIRPSASFQGAAVVVLDPVTEGRDVAYINGVGEYYNPCHRPAYDCVSNNNARGN